MNRYLRIQGAGLMPATVTPAVWNDLNERRRAAL